ncbi:trehalose 6-phosphate phosphatase [Sphingomonas sp. DBB INV C78]|uniref:trehalose-phosphatase n=1 Tax=Sphingomonas sp. DBB INV C78 TaxID=3349434 RepID=UPI0036D36642
MHGLVPAPPANLLRDASLFLDFDGTLVEIAERPDAVRVDERLAGLLSLLFQKLDGRIALISGRPADEVRTLTGLTPLTIVGSHGMQFQWADGRRSMAPRPAALVDILQELRDLAARLPGVLVEDKPLGAALHFRQAPDAEATCIALAEGLATAHGLTLQFGKMMIEVRASGGDKGSAVRTLMAEPAFASGRPLFMGDDVTDEPGFTAAVALGGAGVLVGPERTTAARYRLPGVGEALRWLEAACKDIS